MSTIETVLTRAMGDRAFADALFADPEKALAEYDLPADAIAKFKDISRAKFEALATEDRRSMSARLGTLKKGSGPVKHMEFKLEDFFVSK